MNTSDILIPAAGERFVPNVDFSSEPFVTAKQASAALNMPLYYLINTQKRQELGIPYYSINRMVRFRIRELHMWRVEYLVRKSRKSSAVAVGGVDG
jgi:hypothetical protein